MKKITTFIFLLLAWQIFLKAQENVTYQKPSGDILALAEYERAPSDLGAGSIPREASQMIDLNLKKNP